MRVRQTNRVSSNRLPGQKSKVINGFFDTIKVPSSPHVTTYQDLPEDQDDWGCGAWYAYFERNEEIAGRQYAIEYFVIDVDKLNYVADLWTCQFNCDFVQWLDKKGIPFGSIPISNVYCTMHAVTETTRKYGEQSSWLLPVVLGTAVVLAVAYREPIADALGMYVKIK